MAKGNEIVLSGNPKGVFLEGTIDDTSKPGTIMQIKAGVAPVGGRHTWIAAAPGTDGEPAIIAILCADNFQGKLITDAYVAGTRCFMYCPIAGEEVNVLLGEVAGTGNTFTVGDGFILNATGGWLVPNTGTPGSVPFICLEPAVQVVASTLTWCMFTGQ